MTDLRIILERVQRTTGSIYNTLRCIQKVSYAVIILPIINKFKDELVRGLRNSWVLRMVNGIWKMSSWKERKQNEDVSVIKI